MMKNSIISSALRAAALLIACAWLAACAQGQGQGPGIDTFLHPPTKGPTATLVPPEEIDLRGQLDAQGRALAPLNLEAPDGCLHLEVEQGTTVLNGIGEPAARLVIQQDYPGKLPMEAYGVAASYAYRFGPTELRFSKPIKVRFSCMKNYKMTLVSETSVGIQGDGGEWDQISVQGDDKTVWTRLETLKPGSRYLLVGPAPMGS